MKEPGGGRRTVTTRPGEAIEQPPDVVHRNFTAACPNALWVADLTYVATWRGFVYVAFIIDAFARRIVGWRVSNSLSAALALDALEQALYDREISPRSELIHHSDSEYMRAGSLGVFTTVPAALAAGNKRWSCPP